MTHANTLRRERLFRTQDGKCHYCEIQMRLAPGKHDSVTTDEIVPRCQGGNRGRRNTVGACWACNNARGSMDYKAFREFVRINGRPKNEPRLPQSRHARLQAAHDQAREEAIKQSGAPWSRGMSAQRPYLQGIDRHPTLAAALIDAGVAEPTEEGEGVQL